ncbi:hypothetical protein JJC03_12995 [Flavobacterium oreochromis]|uniref:hypothetical protein n=1 Tax=Flavobacterium oreochromis TaxID=2906078 RepID=UPI001CE6F47A|nr:hypothetical protein [Flavobacterium oreochromis]QYS85953.1 hypothetical protein JJC03_12995 [Flavobacterium oreochromis]
MKIIKIILTVLIFSSCKNNFKEKEILKESLSTEENIENKGKMKPALYIHGNDEAIPNLKNLKDSFVIIIDTTKIPKNYVSAEEMYEIKRSKTLDTSDLNWTEDWEKLTAKQKKQAINSEKNLSRNQATFLHKANNSKENRQVWIINNTNNSVSIPMQDYLFICVLEAKDKRGLWKPIEYWRFSDCGNSYYEKIFRAKSSNSFITKIPNSGNYKTILRFKLLGKNKFYYSNEFQGKIDYLQFIENTNDFDERRGKKQPHYKLDSLINIS